MGVSTRRVKALMEQICGQPVSIAKWGVPSSSWKPGGPAPRRGAISDPGRPCKTMAPGRHMRDCSVLIAVGVRDDGRRSVLGVSVSLSEAEVHWQEFSRLPAEAGHARHAVGRERSHEGLRAARKAMWLAVPRSRCQYHPAPRTSLCDAGGDAACGR